MSQTESEIVQGIGSDYEVKYGFHVPEDYFFKSGKGLSHELIDAISSHKSEPDWMRRFPPPAFTKSGTLTLRPEAIVAGFVAPVAVSPLIPWSVETTVITTDAGMSTPIASPWYSFSVTSMPSTR